MDDAGGGGAVAAPAPETGQPPTKAKGGCGGAALTKMLPKSYGGEADRKPTAEMACGSTENKQQKPCGAEKGEVVDRGVAKKPASGGCGGGAAKAPQTAAEEKEALVSNYSRMYTVPKGDLARADRLGYTERFIKLLPECFWKSFYGSANPWTLGDPKAGSTVVDFGSGLGVDCMLAHLLGAGKVVGIDLTPKAVADSETQMKALGVQDKISFRVGDLEMDSLGKKLGLAGQVDLITSNGVINLTDDKQKVYHNAFAMLKPGGMMRFSDMAMETPLPTDFG